MPIPKGFVLEEPSQSNIPPGFVLEKRVLDPVNNAALSPQEQFAAAAEAQPAAGIRSLLTGTPMPTEPKAPRPPSEFSPVEELVQGLGMGANIALPSMWEQAGVLKDVGALSTVQQRLDLFNKIENGEITSPDQLFGLDTVNSQGRMYFASGPDMRAKIRERALSEIGNRKEFVAASLETLDRYQKDSVKYKGRTTDLTDVENLADFTNWLAYNVGSGAVQMAPIMLAAVTTGGVGVGLLGAGMGTAGAVDDRLNFLKDKVKDMPRGQRADAVINYIKETGDTTLAVGIINGMFDVVLGPDAALAKRGLKQVLAGETKMQALKAGIKEAPGQMAGEAITGGAQQAVQIAGQIAEKEQDKFLTEKNIKDIINSAAAEAAGSIAGSAATTGARVYGAKGEELPAQPPAPPAPPTPPAPPPAAPVTPVAPAPPPPGAPAKPTGFAAPSDFRYSLLQSPYYEGLDPLSLEDADFELEAMEENANRGRLTPEQFAQSEIGKRLGTSTLMAINAGLKVDPVGTIQALRNNLTPKLGGTAAPPSGLTAAPSDSMDTDAMLREALEEPPKGTVTPVNVPEAKQEEAPTTNVTLYRGAPKGERDTVGGALFKSPDKGMAESYAGKEGVVTEEVHSFKNPLQAATWAEAKQKLGLPQSATMSELVAAAREAGHDVVTFKANGQFEYIVLDKEAPAATPATSGRMDRLEAKMANAKIMLANGQMTQEKYDEIEENYKFLKALAAKPVNQKPVAPYVEPTGEFKDERPLAQFFADYKEDRTRLENLPKYGQPEVESVIANLDAALQKVTNAINAAGYSAYARKHNLPAELRPLLEQYSLLTGGASRLLMEAERVANGKKLASQEKLDRSIKESKADIEAANALAANQPAKPAAIEPSEAPADQTKLPGRAVVEAPLNKLTLSEDVPQFKADANKAGIVEPLGGTFERTGVAPIQVWRRTDGRLEVISGRHRFDLAKRSGEETIPAQIHDEASGFTRDKAAVLDAELNIRDGQGKVKDYVNYFKGTGLDQKTADTRGLLARAPGKRAFAIANQGSDELVAGVRADQIGDEAAYLIAINAPNDSRLQGVAIKAILDGKSAVNAINLMQAVKALAGETDTTLDMFGFDDSAMKEAEAMAKIAAAKQREMQTRLSAISGAAKNPAVAKAEGIDIKDPEAVKRRINELKQMKVAWDSWSTNPDLIAEIRAERGMPAPAPTAREEEVPAAIENEIDQLFGSIEEAEQMVADNLTPKEQDDELEKARNEQAKDEGAAKGAESESQDLFAEPSETLTSPTPEGLKAQEDRRKAVEAAESKADKEAAAKEKADREAGEFVLTGSDRVADEAAARGQKDIFAEDEEVTEEGVKVVPFEADSETVGNLLKETQEGEDPSDIRRNALMHSTEKPAKPNPTEMLTPKEGKAKMAEWKAEARRQGESGKNSGRTILSLFDASGEWAKPWYEAGYDVHTFDLQTGEDINDFNVEYLLENGFGDLDVWGILAAPPCTDFASVIARLWDKKDASGQTELSNELVRQVLRTVSFLQPKIWAMENPVGRIAKLHNLPPAQLLFNPNFYGNPHTKKTLIWGNFQNNLPMAPVEATEGDKTTKLSGKNKYARSLTPEGFAYAFFMANNAESMTPTERLTRTYYGVDPKVFEGATEADEKAIKSSEFEDSYYDGDLERAANIASYIINGEPDIQEELPSEEYQEALDESNVAIKEFKKVQDAYRAQEIGDDEFLAGRKTYDAAMAKFDRAYQQEGEPAKLEPVETPEGGKLRYPMAAVLFNDGFKVLPLNDSRSYVDKGGKVHRTFIKKEGVRVSLTPQLVLFQNKNAVLTGQGESTDLVINALLVDQSKRGQGLASETLQSLTDAADQYGITLYLEPTPLVNIQEKNFGLDRQQLEDLYQKFGFEFAEDSNKVMVREPEVEVLGPAEKPEAPRLTNEPYTIEGEFTEVGEERQNALLEGQVSKLKKDQINTLEDLYGAKRGTNEFIERVRKDVIAFINQGAVAVKGRIRSIIRQMASGVLSAALVFNPVGLTNNFKFNLSKTYKTTVTTQVKAEVPANAKDKMSTLAQSVYESMAPTAKASGKGFIIADKPNGMMHVFFTDGSMLIQDTALYGKDIGDVEGDASSLTGGPKITPAGKFTLMAMPDSEYAGGVTLGLSETANNGIIAVHAAYLGNPKEKRLERLAMPGAEGKRISYGCINTAHETFLKSILPNIDALDGGMIFVLPDNQTATAAMFPAETKTTVKEERVPAPKPGVERKQTGREEKVKVTQKEEKENPEGPEQNFYSIEVEQTKTPAFKRWFGDSKVVDAEGNPLVVYHGTDAPVAIDSFLKSNSGNEGYWFAGDVSLANDFAMRRNGENAAVYPVYLAINKVAPSLQAWNSSVDAKDGKYDGYIGKQPDGRKVYAVLRNTQIKSAIGNTGAFDATNPDIRYNLDAYVNEEKSKRSPSLIRRLKTLNRQHKEGKLSDEQYITMSDEAIRADHENAFLNPTMARKRGYLLIQEKLSAAARRGEISREIFDLANWFMSQNEDLVSDLGISITGKGADGTGGFYNNLSRVFTLMKGASSDLTAVHEILHHLERMMPAKVQQAIRKAWASQLAKANKQAKTPAEKLYFAALMDAHYGSNQHSMLNIPEGAGKAYSDVREAMLNMPEDTASSAKFAETMLKLGLVPMANYEYVNPSEFWAVNGSDIVKARFDAVRGGVLARLKNWLKELGQKIKSIFGMKSDASIIRALDSLAKSDGEFLSKEMLGQGDYFSIERRNFRGNEAPESTFEAPVPSPLDDFAYNFLDKQHDMKSVIEAIKKARGELIKEQVDPYLKNESFISRRAAREQYFVDDEIMPIVQELYKNKISIIELEAYMHNRHAEERNEQIAKINLELPDGGSGIKTKDALKYLTEVPPDKLAIYNRIAGMFDKVIDETQTILIDSGAEVPKTINAWNNTYEYYAPLQREDLDFVNHGVGNGGGLQTRGSFSRRAFGSTKNVANILQNIILQRKRGIDRAERIRVGKSLMGLVLTNPNPKFWLPINPNAIKSIKKFQAEVQSLGIDIENAENMLEAPKSASLDKETGLVKYTANPAMYKMDNVFPVRINGQDWFIIFNPSDDRAMRMVRSLKNLDVEKLGIFLGTIGMVTRWISAINTQYNPIFGAFNFGRDVGTGMLQLTTTELAGQQKAVRKSIIPAMLAIMREQRDWSKSATQNVLGQNDLTPNEWRDLYHRWVLAGGRTGISANFTQQKTRIEKLEKGWGIKGLLSIRPTTNEITLLETKLKELDRGKINFGIHWLFDYLSDYNEAMEGAVRLAVFKVAVIDNKMSDDKGASLSKNATLNFDRKGAVVPKLQAWWSFINPGIQGAATVAKVLNGPRGRAIIAGGIGLGVFQALVLLAAGFDDDDPPEFVKSKAFVVPTGGGDYFIMYPPYPPGFSMLPGIGRMLTEAFLIKAKAMKSNESASDKIFDILPMMLDSLNPLGIGATWQQLMPTPVDPIANVLMNRDAFGRPIAKMDRPNEETPGYERSRATASTISKNIAFFLNWSSSPSGTLHTKGKISPTADQLDYLAEQYFGGVFRDMVKAGETIGAKVTGEEQPIYRVPVVGKFIGETKTPAATSSRFYDNIERMNKYEYEIKQREKNKEPTAKYMKDNPSAKLWEAANTAQSDVNKLNKEKREYIARGESTKAGLKDFDDRKIRRMKEFNDQVRATQ